MNCRFCGTELPADAMFCGECGRPVAASAPVQPAVAAGPMPVAFSSAADASEDPADHVGHPLDPAAGRCPQCGSPVGDDEIFCGECGFVLRTVAPLPPAGPPPVDDVPVDPGAEDEDDRLAPERESWDAVGAPAESPGPDLSATDVVPALEPDLELSLERVPRPDPFPWGRATPPIEDIEATRLVADPFAGERFVLQFSTGENVTVRGAGLVGRNPGAQPGEFVDQLVAVFDPTRSVSKTHLEFGQEGGRFWVSDRFSTNGTVVRQPDADPRRCDPGKRYFIARGTRVDIGEQFFVVS